MCVNCSILLTTMHALLACYTQKHLGASPRDYNSLGLSVKVLLAMLEAFGRRFSPAACLSPELCSVLDLLVCYCIIVPPLIKMTQTRHDEALPIYCRFHFDEVGDFTLLQEGAGWKVRDGGGRCVGRGSSLQPLLEVLCHRQLFSKSRTVFVI